MLGLLGATKLSLHYEGIHGSQDRFGHEIEGRIQTDYWENQQIFASYQRLSRSYVSASSLYDQIFSIGHNFSFQLPLSVLVSGSYSPSPDFSAQWAGLLEPHLILVDRLDFGLGVQIKKYSQETSILLRPSGEWTFSDAFSAFARGDLLMKPQNLGALEAGIRWLPVPKFQIRMGAGVGKTYEGVGLSDSFKQINAALKFRVVDYLALMVLGQIYRGDLRDENRFGGGIECSF